MAHAQRERYAELVDIKLRSTLVTVDGGAVPVFNTRYEGSPKAGAVHIPVRDTEVGVRTYNKDTGISLATGTTTFLTVTDFHDVAVNEIIDGYDAASVPANLVADRLDSAGYSGGLFMDSDAISTLEADGTTLADTAEWTPATAYAGIVDAGATHDRANVPRDGMRWAIVRPETYAVLLKDTTNFIRYGDGSQLMLQQGYLGQINGYHVKVSTNMDDNTEAIFGHNNWCHRIREWVITPWIQDLNGDSLFVGASAVKGRWVFKHAVSKGQTVLVKTFA